MPTSPAAGTVRPVSVSASTGSRPSDRAVPSSKPERAAEEISVPVFATLESTFRMLCRGPSPLALPARLLGLSGPRRVVRLVEVRELMLWPGWLPLPVREAAWSKLVARAQRCGPGWVVGAAGMALPGLKSMGARLAAGYRGDCEDLDAELLAGFLTALRTIDPHSGRLAGRLCWAAYRAGARLRHAETAASARHGGVVESAAPPRPWGHPDLVLVAAVAEGVITAAEADLIGRTRLEGERLAATADRLGVSLSAVTMRRLRAEERLTAAIREGQLAWRPTATGGNAADPNHDTVGGEIPARWM